MQYIELEGNSRQIGKVYGSVLRHKLQMYGNSYRTTVGGAEREARILAIIEGPMKENCPWLIEELDAMADGAGLPREDVLRIVFINELWWAFQEQRAGDCTALGFRGRKLLAQTLDSPDGGCFVISKVKPQDGLSFLAISRLGSGGSGVNQAGIAIASVSSFCNGVPSNTRGLSFFVLKRMILQRCSSLAEVEKLIRTHSLLAGNYTMQVMDREGIGFIAEISPWDTWIIPMEGDYAYNTVFTSDKMQKYYIGAENDCFFKRAKARLKTFAALVSQIGGTFDHAAMKKIMSDHSAVGPIWSWTTIWGAIMCTNKRSIEVFQGPPDYSFSETYAL